MKKSIALLALSLVTFAGTSMADNSFYVKARVIQTQPIYETVRVNNPVERCWDETVEHRGRGRGKSYTPTIAGAVVGGVVGNQFGKGRGNDAMTAAGALLGGSIGHDIGKKRSGRGRTYVTTEQRCELIDNFSEHDELVGYRVKYKFKGKVFHTRTKFDPGQYLEVKITVAPVRG